MVGDRPAPAQGGRASVSQAAEPSPWGSARAGSSARERLVGVVEERGRLDEPAVDGTCRGCRSAPPASPRPRPRRARGARTRAGDRGRAAGRRPPPARAPSSPRWYPTVGRRPPGCVAIGHAGAAGNRSAGGRRRRCRDEPGDRDRAQESRCGRRPGLAMADRGRGRLGGSRRGVALGRAPSVRTVIPAASKPTTTVPSRSVRRTRAPDAASRSSVALAGCPYGLPAPAEATATCGPDRLDERLRRRGPAAVVGDLEQVDARQALASAATGRCPPRRRPSAGTGAARPRRAGRPRRC